MNREQPSVEDWTNVLNDLRKVIGQEPLPLLKLSRIPTDKELEEFDLTVPGASNILRKNAWEEMNHRLSLRSAASPL